MAMFGAGITIFTKVMSQGENLHGSLTQSMTSNLNNMMDDGSPFVVLNNKETASRTKTVQFAFGFWNDLGETRDFRVEVTPSNILWDGYMQYFDEYDNVEPNEKKHVLLLMQIPKEANKEQYHFDISVEYKDDTGAWQLHTGKKKRIYVVVK